MSLDSIGQESPWLSGVLDKAKRGAKGVVIRAGMAADSSSVGRNLIDGLIEMFSDLIGLFKVIVEDGNFYIIYLDYFSYKRYFKILELKKLTSDTLIDNILFDRLIDFMVINFPKEYENLKMWINKICDVDLDIIIRNSIEINCIREYNDVKIELKYTSEGPTGEDRVFTLAEIEIPPDIPGSWVDGPALD